MTKERVASSSTATGSSIITGSDRHCSTLSAIAALHHHDDSVVHNLRHRHRDVLSTSAAPTATVRRTPAVRRTATYTQGHAARQRKADMCAAAAAMISSAAKASKQRQQERAAATAAANVDLSADRAAAAALGKELIHRVDAQTILSSVDRIVAAPPASSRSSTSSCSSRTSTNAASAKMPPSPYPSTPTSPEPVSDDDAYDNNADGTTKSPPPALEPNSRNPVQQPADEKLVALASRIPFKRKAAVNELLATERTYNKDLKVLVNYYLDAIQRCDCISESKKQDLIRNAQDVLQFQHGFAAALEAACATPVAEHGSVDHRLIAICECFCEWADQFSVYIPYCIHHDRATDLLDHLLDTNQRFASLLDKLHAYTRAHDERRTLQDYLIMPVQRLLKYKLILGTVAKTVQPCDPEYDIMDRALGVMHHVASRINSEKSILETKRKTKLFVDRVDWHSIVGASDRFVKELGVCPVIGTLDVRVLHMKGDNVKRLGCALFPTYMVLTTAKRQGKYTPQHWFPLCLMDLEDIPDDQPNACYAWLLRSESRVFQFFAMSEQEKRLWIDALQKAIQRSRELYGRGDAITTTDQPLPVSAVVTQQPKPTKLALCSHFPVRSAPSSPQLASTSKDKDRPPDAARSTSLTHFPSSLFSRPHAHHTTTPPASPVVSTVSPMRACCTSPDLFSSHLQDSLTSRHRSSSQATFRDLLSSTMADIRAHRRCSNYYDQCTLTDKRFADVSYTSVLVARTQASNERSSLIEQRKKYTRSRVAKSISMVALNTLLPAHPPGAASPRQHVESSPLSSTAPTTPESASIISDDPISPNSTRAADSMRRQISLPDRLPSAPTPYEEEEPIQ